MNLCRTSTSASTSEQLVKSDDIKKSGEVPDEDGGANTKHRIFSHEPRRAHYEASFLVSLNREDCQI